jgi:ketosteroid isomerase-like protein
LTAGVFASQLPEVSTEEALIALERGWNEAFYARDVEFLDSILADDFIVTYDDGARGDKTRELELAASFNQRVISATQEDFTVQVYDDAAVVWFTLRVVGIRQGQEAEIALRYTDVWVIRDGRWQCVASQSTRLSPR